MFKEVSSRVDFPQMEEMVLRQWAEEQTFQASLAHRADAPEYLFYDGPPFATGLLIMGIYWQERSKILFRGIKRCVVIGWSVGLVGIVMGCRLRHWRRRR